MTKCMWCLGSVPEAEPTWPPLPTSQRLCHFALLFVPFWYQPCWVILPPCVLPTPGGQGPICHLPAEHLAAMAVPAAQNQLRQMGFWVRRGFPDGGTSQTPGALQGVSCRI